MSSQPSKAVEPKNKPSKKAQKAAKQEEKKKELPSKPERKEFTQLTGILTRNRSHFENDQYLIIKNKTVQ